MNVDFKNWFGTKKRPWQPPSGPPLSPFIPPAPGMYHINPIINGQRYQPPAGLPQWSNGDIEFPVEQQVGTIMKRVIEPLIHGGRMSIDYELSGPVDELLGSADRTGLRLSGLMVHPPWRCELVRPAAARTQNSLVLLPHALDRGRAA